MAAPRPHSSTLTPWQRPDPMAARSAGLTQRALQERDFKGFHTPNSSPCTPWLSRNEKANKKKGGKKSTSSALPSSGDSSPPPPPTWLCCLCAPHLLMLCCHSFLLCFPPGSFFFFAFLSADPYSESKKSWQHPGRLPPIVTEQQQQQPPKKQSE